MPLPPRQGCLRISSVVLIIASGLVLMLVLVHWHVRTCTPDTAFGSIVSGGKSTAQCSHETTSGAPEQGHTYMRDRVGHPQHDGPATPHTNEPGESDTAHDSHFEGSDDDHYDGQSARSRARFDPTDSHAIFQELLAEGETLLQAISASADDATDILEEKDLLEIDTSSQSQFIKYNDLYSNGWVKADSDKEPLKDFRFTGSEDAKPTIEVPLLQEFRALRLSTSIATSKTPGDNYVIGWQHKNKRPVDGVTYIHTEAIYINVYNPRNGVIVAFLNYSPAHKIETDDELTELFPEVKEPPLHEWWDVVFLQYQALRTDVSNLRYIFFNREDNGDTDEVWNVVRVALDPINEHPLGEPRIPGWKRRLVYGMDQEVGKAMLGSRLGQRVAWLLISRKGELGRKRVKSVSVWMDDRAVAEHSTAGTDVSVMFELEDVGGGVDGSRGGLGAGAGHKRPRLDDDTGTPSPAAGEHKRPRPGT